MSCLTKKSLFFLVLSIVCNTAFSDKFSECLGSVHEVFQDGVEPWDYLPFAMFSLSEKLITSMEDTNDYLNYYMHNGHVLEELYINQPIYKKHGKILNYYDSLIKWLQSPITYAQYNISVETKQQYILGYFQSLIVDNDNFENKIRSNVDTPQGFCDEAMKAGMDKLPLQIVGDTPFTKDVCLEVIYKMLDLNDLEESMDNYDIFVHVYKKYNYLDFSAANYFPFYIDSGIDLDYWNIKDRGQLSLMALYLRQLTTVTKQVVNELKEQDLRIFPTIQDYCNKATSS